MSRVGYTPVWQGSLLLLLGGMANAEAQYPPSRSTTSAVGWLRLGDTAIVADRRGQTRELVCRGAPGLTIATHQDSSPRNPTQVVMSLAYRRNSKPAGSAYEQLEPGVCTWNPLGIPDLPPEPGVVYFDLHREGSAETPDPSTLPLYLGDARHYWVFYPDDVTHFAVSHGAFGGQFRVTSEQRRTSSATALRGERLRCRGGTGLTFRRRAREGANLVGMTLVYQVASRAAGPIGGGLEPGTCAWADRTDAREEPGRIRFTTAGNAQLKQKQSGRKVDRSPTAAERWPDVHTIPVYLADPKHYWTFIVRLADPDSALRHAAWKPAGGEVVVTTPASPDTVPTAAPPAPAAPVPTTPAPTTTDPMPTGGAGGSAPSSSTTTSGPVRSYTPGSGSTTVSLPRGSTVTEEYSPGAGTTSVTDPRIPFDIRDVQVTSGLEGVVIRFEAGPEIAPSVLVSTAAPVGTSGAQRFDGQTVRMTVSGTPAADGRWRYVAASGTPLARGTEYWFLADAPEGRMSRPNQAAGQFRTLAQHVTIGITEIYLISDGDSDGNGELYFELLGCPRLFDMNVAGSRNAPLDWSEGRHQIAVASARTDISVPDRFRILIGAVEDDQIGTESGGTSSPLSSFFYCDHPNPDLGPGKNNRVEWNAVTMDVDLTTMPGAEVTQTFQRRSKPLADGSTLMFEVRGWIRVNRE